MGIAANGASKVGLAIAHPARKGIAPIPPVAADIVVILIIDGGSVDIVPAKCAIYCGRNVVVGLTWCRVCIQGSCVRSAVANRRIVNDIPATNTTIGAESDQPV